MPTERKENVALRFPINPIILWGFGAMVLVLQLLFAFIVANGMNADGELFFLDYPWLCLLIQVFLLGFLFLSVRRLYCVATVALVPGGVFVPTVWGGRMYTWDEVDEIRYGEDQFRQPSLTFRTTDSAKTINTSIYSNPVGAAHLILANFLAWKRGRRSGTLGPDGLAEILLENGTDAFHPIFPLADLKLAKYLALLFSIGAFVLGPFHLIGYPIHEWLYWFLLWTASAGAFWFLRTMEGNLRKAIRLTPDGIEEIDGEGKRIQVFQWGEVTEIEHHLVSAKAVLKARDGRRMQVSYSMSDYLALETSILVNAPNLSVSGKNWHVTELFSLGGGAPQRKELRTADVESPSRPSRLRTSRFRE